MASGLLGVLLVGAGIALLVYVQISAEGSAVNVLSATMFKGFYALPCLGLGLLRLRTVWSNWGTAVAVFDRELTITRGRSVRRIRWEEVLAVGQVLTQKSLEPRSAREYSVQLTDGTKYTWDGRYYEDFATLGEEIATRTDFADILPEKYED